MFRFCFKENFPELLGETRELSKVFFEKIRIKEVDENIENDFKNSILEIQELKSIGIDTSYQELMIEKKIATLYDITDTEFEIINKIE